MWLCVLTVTAALALEQRDVVPNQGPNAAGSKLGVFAMCGGDPVDCGQGWCCLKDQKCVIERSSAIACYDDELSMANKYVAADQIRIDSLTILCQSIHHRQRRVLWH